jgi:hypothetical protein
VNPKKPPALLPPAAMPAVIDANAVYTLDEAARRLRWRRHSIRQALRAGLATAKFGSRRYVTGRAIYDFVDRLANEQTENLSKNTLSPGS